MANQTNKAVQSAADLERVYLHLCAQIRSEAAQEERQRLRQLYIANTEDGVKLMEQAAERRNNERRARSY
jgi:hypothetical protein